jgi:hypothetical protein
LFYIHSNTVVEVYASATVVLEGVNWRGLHRNPADAFSTAFESVSIPYSSEGTVLRRDPRHIRLHSALVIIAKHQPRFLLVPYGIERANMYIPRVGEQVYVDELRGVFVVAWVDDETQTVDLVPSSGSAPREEYVPWKKLLGCWNPRIETVNAAPGLMR